ncbi:MAG: uracil-DNA glycosylase [Planctomycetota bacterium]|jgi:uracil-DNA glycosylase family 4
MRRPLAERIVACRRCPRLRAHCREIARVKRAAYRDEPYWGKPVPSFGVRQPRLLIVGLAPGAHGANRTGRLFTGDASGDWLFRGLHRFGFASQPTSRRGGDGLRLRDTVITAAAHCAPPQNKPTRDELDACRRYLAEEIETYRRLRVVLVLGRIAHDAFCRAWEEAGRDPFPARPRFAHGADYVTEGGAVTLLCSYHPSRQNTQTGRLTREMFHCNIRRARRLLDG